jgi:hypothetical protein
VGSKAGILIDLMSIKNPEDRYLLTCSVVYREEDGSHKRAGYERVGFAT